MKRPRRRRIRLFTKIFVGIFLVWLVTAYLIMPEDWSWYAERHPSFDDNPRITQSGDRHPGDPLNVALIGSEAQLQQIMKNAGWYPAAALALESDLRIGVDSVLSRPDDEAPVSTEYLFGRKEDLAFEQPVGDNPRHRHHVRLWRTATSTSNGLPKWIGSAVYDKRVGLSRTTGQITHVTAPDVDSERDYLFECLKRTGQLTAHYVETSYHDELEGLNGGGDPWHTDGSLYVGVIADDKTP